MRHNYLVVHLDGRVQVTKLCRALASHGLVISNGPDGVLWIHDAPQPPPADGRLQGYPPRVSVGPPHWWRTPWWRR